MLRTYSPILGTSMSLIETAGIIGDRYEDLSSYGNQFIIPVYGYDVNTMHCTCTEEHRVRVVNEYTPYVDEYDVFFFEECVVYNTAGGLIVVRDAK
jgi:hypothetical protein